MNRNKTIFKILTQDEWVDFQRKREFEGSELDQADGFIHMSAETELQGTLDKYYTPGEVIILLAMKSDKFDTRLKWEESRDGAMFPHFYGALNLSHIRWRRQLRADDEGRFDVSDFVGEVK